MLLTLQIVSALVTASILFLQAAGLTLIFGVCRVLNLAHGTFFMLGWIAERDTAIVRKIVDQHAGQRGTDGAPRSAFVVATVHAVLGAYVDEALVRGEGGAGQPFHARVDQGPVG